MDYWLGANKQNYSKVDISINILAPVYGIDEGELNHCGEQENRAAQEPNFAGFDV